jgi:zinc-binding alcohol dehydrogenase family protein
MKAVGYYQPGAISRPDALIDLDLPEPEPGPRDLKVRIKAVSINPLDAKVRGSTPAPADGPQILGWDAAGIVEAVGSQVTLFAPGDAVYYAGDLTRPGTNAQVHIVDERIVGSKPASLDWTEAAVLPLTAITAWEILFDRLAVPRESTGLNRTLLVINGAGGVGSILIQLARQLTDLTVVATASRPETISWCRRMGAHHVIDHRTPLADALRGAGLDEAHYVASLTGTEAHLPQIFELIAPQGRIAMIDDPKCVDMASLKRKSVSLSWEYMFTRSMFETDDMIRQHELLEEVSALVDKGLLVSTLTKVLSPINAATMIRAHVEAESRTAIGKTAIEGF